MLIHATENEDATNKHGGLTNESIGIFTPLTARFFLLPETDRQRLGY